MDNWMILIGIFVLIFAGVFAWGITSSILSYRKQMAKLKLERSGEARALSAENNELKETIAHMQDRLAVLETIATDPARRTADEIAKPR